MFSWELHYLLVSTIRNRPQIANEKSTIFKTEFFNRIGHKPSVYNRLIEGPLNRALRSVRRVSAETSGLNVGSLVLHRFNGQVVTVRCPSLRDRFNSAAEVQKYGGIAPVTERSGQQLWIHWRWQAPTFLRQTFTEWAAQTINKSYWAGLYYYQQRERGCSYQAAVRALAFKWIRILYRCWKTRTPYDEARYLKALQERGSPLLKLAESA